MQHYATQTPEPEEARSRKGRTLGALLLATALTSSGLSLAQGCEVRSGPDRVALLELYTSEGCSSCPPAESWLSTIAQRGYSTERVIPLALHVDYWDYIGWKDGFAKPAFSARQRELAALGRSDTIYTPQVMLDGKDFRNWFDSGRFAETVARINRSPPQATIALMLAPAGTDSVEASVSAQAVHADHAALYLALFENDLYTPVKAGENTGTLLHHDFVVREWLGPYPVGDRGATTWRQTIAFRPGWKTKDLGVVSFVQNRATGEVLQAVAATLCR